MPRELARPGACPDSTDVRSAREESRMPEFFIERRDSGQWWRLTVAVPAFHSAQQARSWLRDHVRSQRTGDYRIVDEAGEPVVTHLVIEDEMPLGS